MKELLPSHYEITETDKFIRCRSVVGLRTNEGNDDDEHWSYVLEAIKQKYKSLKEVYFNTNAYYQDFVIYL